MGMLGSFSGGGLGFGLAMHLQDSFSGPAKKIEGSLNSLNSGVEQASAAINNNLNLLGKGALTAGAGAAALAVTFAAPISRSIELSDKLADVRKTTGFTNEEVDNFRKTLQGIDTRTNLDDLLDIGRIGGQIGIAKDQLEGFTKSTDKLAVALGDEFTGGAEQVSAEIGGIGKAFGVFKDKGVEQGMLNIGNALNKLGAEGLATANYLSNFTTRLAASARSAKASVGDIIGLGAAFSELKIAPEQGSSGVERALSLMGNNLENFAKVAGLNVDQFKEDFEKNGVLALLNFSEGIKENSKTSEDWLKNLKTLRLNGIGTAKAIGSMAYNTDLFREKIKSAGLGMEDTASIMDEFSVKNNTLAARIDKMKKKWDNVLINIGEVSKGPFNLVIEAIDRLLTGIGKFLGTKVGQYIVSIIGVLGTLAVAVGGAMVSVALFRIGLIKLSFAFGEATAASVTHAVANGRLGVAFKLMGRAALQAAGKMWASFAPMLPTLLLVSLGIYAIWKSINTVRKGLKLFNDSTTEVLGTLKGFEKTKAIIGGVYQAAKEFWQLFDGANSAITKSTFDKLQVLGISKENIEALGSYVVRAKALWEGFKLGFKIIWEGITIIWETIIKPVFNAIWDMVKNVFSAFGVDLENLGGKLSTFKGIGIAIAGVITTVVVPAIIGLAGSMWSLAAGVIAATWPILLVIAAVLLAIYIFKNWDQIVIYLEAQFERFNEWMIGLGVQANNWGKELMSNLWEGIKNKWNEFNNWMIGLGVQANNWGKELMINLWEGVKNKWDEFKDWLINSWKDLMKLINPVNWFGDDDELEEEQKIVASKRILYNHEDDQNQLALARASMATARGDYTPNVNVDASQGDLNNQIYLDGELISQNVGDRQQMDNVRTSW